MRGGFWEILLIVILLGLFYMIVSVPINIAKRKGVKGSDLTTIIILSWLGIFFGITWIIALIYACAAENKNSMVEKKESDMDKLEKAYKLMKKGIISKKEYEKIKKETI